MQLPGPYLSWGQFLGEVFSLTRFAHDLRVTFIGFSLVTEELCEQTNDCYYILLWKLLNYLDL